MKTTTPLTLIGVYQNDAMLKRVFSWLTRIGVSPKFGSRPIGWYQMHQCAAIDELLRLGIRNPVSRNGIICERGQAAGYFVAQIYDKADKACRS